MFTALDGTEQQPPNNQLGVVNASEGTVIICYPYDGVSLDANGQPEPDFDQMTANGAQSSGAGTFVVNSIPINTPQVGVLRINNGTFLDYVPYSSFSGSTFTLVGTLPSSYADAAECFIGYIDDVVGPSGQISFTSVYGGTPTQMIVLARRSETDFLDPTIQVVTFGATGFEVTANEIPD